MAKIDLKSPFSRIVLVYTLWVAGWLLSGSFFEVYFLKLGMSIQEIFLSEAFLFLASMATIPFLKGFRARDFMLAGIAVSFISVLLLILYPRPEMSFVFRLLGGLTHITFWVPFNTLFYEFRKENHGILGAIYYSISPVLSLVLPIIGGMVAASIGFPALFSLALVVFAANAAATYMFVENRAYTYDLTQALHSISGLRSLLFLEGFSAMIIINVTLAITPLRYFSTPLGLGAFLSISTIFSVAASFVAARLSDKVRRRRDFILPVVLCFGICTIISSQANDLVSFFIWYGMVNFFSRIFFPLPLALLADNSKSMLDSMVGREYLLNFGRLMGTLLGYAVLVAYGMGAVLILEGAAMLLYIPLFENRKPKMASH